MKKTTMLTYVGFLLFSTMANSVTIGQIDDFENGSLMGWGVGSRSLNPPNNIADGGPLGASDNYLQVVSSGGNGPDSRLVAFNQSQWAGNYFNTGVASISAEMANFGNSELSMRIAIGGPGAPRSPDTNWFVSSDPILLIADGQWQSVSFRIDDANLTQVSGNGSLKDVLSNVNALRILSSSSASFIGDAVTANLGIDNITAIPIPAALWLFASSILMLIPSRVIKRNFI